jgi:hypothetical protein
LKSEIQIKSGFEIRNPDLNWIWIWNPDYNPDFKKNPD